MAYANINEVRSMTSNKKQIKALLQAIIEIKAKIVETWADETLPYAIKTQTLSEMRRTLLDTEHYTLALVEREVEGDK